MSSMPPERWLEYDTPSGPPIRCGHSFYGMAAIFVALIAMMNIVAIERNWLPLSLLPLALGCAIFASAASMAACGASALDHSTKQLFTWIGVAMTSAIPVIAWAATDRALEFLGNLLVR